MFSQAEKLSGVCLACAKFTDVSDNLRQQNWQASIDLSSAAVSTIIPPLSLDGGTALVT